MDRVTDRDVRCPRCSGLFTPDEVRAADPTARCGFCGTELLIRQPPPAPPSAPSPPPRPPPPEMPSVFAVIEVAEEAGPPGGPFRTLARPSDPPHLTIRWRRSRTAWFEIAFPALLAAITVWYLTHRDWGALLIAPVAAWLLVKAVARAVNTSTFRVDRSALVWSSEPIPLWSRVRIATATIAQLFTVVERRGNNDRVFCLKVKTTKGKERQIAELDTANQARWLEWAIERYLEIEDQPVEGELTESNA